MTPSPEGGGHRPPPLAVVGLVAPLPPESVMLPGVVDEHEKPHAARDANEPRTPKRRNSDALSRFFMAKPGLRARKP